MFLQGSVSLYESINDRRTLPDLEIAVSGDLSKPGSSTQLKSPPRTRWCVWRSGNLVIKWGKKTVGCPNLDHRHWLKQSVNQKVYLQKWCICHYYLQFLSLEQKEFQIHPLSSLVHSLERRWVSCRKIISEPRDFRCVNPRLCLIGWWIPLISS